MSVIHITDRESFQTVIDEGGAVLVDFWATWCGPCRMLAPTVDDLAEAYAGRLTVLKADVDEQPELAQEYGVMSIPTLVAFRNGKETGRLVGVQPRAAIDALLELS